MQLITGNGAARVVILGAGFAGLYMALHLANRLRLVRLPIEVTLIDRNNFFLFSPLLHEVTVGMVEMHHVVHPIRHLFRGRRGRPVRFLEATVTGMDLQAKTVTTTQGTFGYDCLGLALGSVTNTFGMENVARYAFPLKTLGEAFCLRNHLLTVFELAESATDPELRRRLLTFVQAGAGFTGIEMVTELRDYIHESLLADYPSIQPEEVRFVLVDGLPCLQAPTHPALAERTVRLIEKKDIELRFDTMVHDAGSGWVQLSNGERIATNTLIWTAGICANPVIRALPVEKGSLQRVCVQSTLQLPGYPEVFALGDCAYLIGEDGLPLPATAQVANQQAPLAVTNMLRYLTDRPLRAFSYHRRGELASLGTNSAIAELGKFKFSGFLAWLIWRAVYLYKMPWWSNRFRIAADWILDLFFRRNTSRVEVGVCPTCTLDDCPHFTRVEEPR